MAENAPFLLGLSPVSGKPVVNGGDKSDHSAAQNKASGEMPSAVARALIR